MSITSDDDRRGEPGGHAHGEEASFRYAAPGASAPAGSKRDTASRRAEETADRLDSLLRGEIAAAETYVQALAKFESEGRPSPEELRRLRDDHVDAANALRRHVAARGESPSTSSGAWGAFAKAVEGTAKIFGNAAALKALKEGEEHGIRVYEDALEDADVAPEVRKLIGERFLPRQREHIVAIDHLIALAAKGR